jgi:hypothetical protein
MSFVICLLNSSLIAAHAGLYKVPEGCRGFYGCFPGLLASRDLNSKMASAEVEYYFGGHLFKLLPSISEH